jgi:hypothetical protein
VDFTPFSASQRIAEILSRHRRTHAIYQVDPVTDLAITPAYRPIEELAAGYASLFGDGARPSRPALVIGYCSAAALSLRVADRIAGAAARVVSVLVQPIWPDDALICEQFEAFRRDLGAGQGSCPVLAGNPGAALQRMQEVLAGDLRTMAEGSGLNASSEVLSQLLARYTAWLGFLLASRDSLLQPWRPELPVHLVAGTSAEQVIPWAGLPSQVTRLPVPDDELVKASGFAELLLGFLEGQG